MAPALGTLDSALEALPVLGSEFTLSDSKLSFAGRPFLSDVPPHVVLTPFPSIHPKTSPHLLPELASQGAFLGFDAASPDSRHVLPLGKLKNTRFCSIFRFKVWWTTQWVGDSGSDLETETQILLLDTAGKASSEGCAGYPYLLVLPIFEGRFRASLQAGEDDNIDVCLESGSTSARESAFRTPVYVHAGHDPFKLFKDAFKAVRVHLGTFKLLEEKTPPSILDKFGWCTWDAFYLTVHPEGVRGGIKSFVDGGVPPRYVLIDDGWQSISLDTQDASEDAMHLTVAGEQMVCRLTRIKENYKFRDYVSTSNRSSSKKPCSCCSKESGKQQKEESKGAEIENGDEEVSTGMGAFIHDLKKEFKLLDEVYVWHALTGYWGGVRPGQPDSFSSLLVQPELTPGLLTRMEDLAVDKLINNTIGLVPPEHVHAFYDAFYAYLAKNGISGVKVDVIHVLEMLGEDYGGRMELSKVYYDALSAAARKHLGGNKVIASMEHCNDFMLLGTEQISFGRVGDDFWCEDPTGDPFWLQGVHMVHCAFNSLWMGQFIYPDWDMFQSKHVCGLFHAASRAISGSSIYVSDTPGQHDFDLLKKMVLPDGTVLRCCNFALPTWDCLFLTPLQDGTTVLKIWNLNKCGGVVGAFNCQGGGWCREERRTKAAKEFRVPCSTVVCPTDVQWGQSSVPLLSEEVEEFVFYLSQADKLCVLKKSDGISVTLDPLTFEIYTIVPVQNLSSSLQFAAIGLLNMLNAGGAVQQVDYEVCDAGEAGTEATVEVEVRGAGLFAAYASSSGPKLCKLDGEEVAFKYETSDGRIVVEVPWKGGENSVVEYIF